MAHALSSRSLAQSTAPPRSWLLTTAVMISATLFIAVCAHISMPLPWTPIPLVAQDFAVILVGFILGPQIGFLTLLIYLAEGAAGLPMFSPHGLGGVAQIAGPTGGFLMAYPAVAALTGALRSRNNNYARNLAAALAGTALLFLCGALYFKLLTGTPAAATWNEAVLPFIPAAIVKSAIAAAIACAWGASKQRREKTHSPLHKA